MAFFDGLTNVINGLTNRRNSLDQNIITKRALNDSDKRAIYKTGVGNKIIRLKAGGALKEALQFKNTHDQDLYNARLARHVKQAAQFMLAFGRGIVVMYERDADLTKPMPTGVSASDISLKVFSGDMITVGNVSTDLTDPRYYKPLSYSVRGFPIHWTRVIDFTYVEPVELDKPEYRYGGISEFELIYEQLVNDGIVERASARIVERNSSFVYKVKGFKEALQAKRDKDVLRYFGAIEDARSIYGAVLVDSEDDCKSVDQTLANLSDVDQITLRRLAMVTGLPLTWLVGESAKGLNSSGETETQTYRDTIETLQSDYLVEPINQLARVFGLGVVKFRDNQGETAASRMQYEAQAIDAALKLHTMGEDANTYLVDRDIIKRDDWESFFSDPDEQEETPDIDPAELLNQQRQVL